MANQIFIFLVLTIILSEVLLYFFGKRGKYSIWEVIKIKSASIFISAIGIFTIGIIGTSLRSNWHNIINVDKWDGHLPYATGGVIPFINIGDLPKVANTST